MANNQDDPQYQGQQSWQGQGSNQPNTPPGQGPVQQGKHGQWHFPAGSRKQQQAIRLPAPSGQPVQRQPDEDPIKTQRQAETPMGANQPVYSGTGGANQGIYAGASGANAAAFQPRQMSRRQEQYDTFDYAVIGIAIVLIAAIIGTIILFLSGSIHAGANPIDNFGRLLPFLIIYFLCGIAGILWGRFQLNTESKKESERLSGMVNQLEGEKEQLQNEIRNLQGHLHTAQSELAAIKRMPPPAPQPPMQFENRAHGRPPSNVVVSPPQIQQIKPQQTIYDVTKDPPDYNEREQREHPHEKLYPERGKSGMLRSGWNVIGASRRGYGHSYDGKYREDDFEVKSIRVDTRTMQLDMVMVAIADGVSSKQFSRRGAREAVRGALSITNTSIYLQELGKAIGKQAPPKQWQDAAYYALMESLGAAHAFVEQRGHADHIHVDEMHSTLLVYLAVPLEYQMFVASVQVGDGALFAMQQSKGATPRERWQWLQQPQIQESGNEVQPFMRTGQDMWRQHFRAVLLESPTFMMGMTDGTLDDIQAPRPTPEEPNPDPFVNIDDFYQHIATDVLKDPQPSEALVKFLGYRKKQSFDDRTVVCFYR